MDARLGKVNDRNTKLEVAVGKIAQTTTPLEARIEKQVDDIRSGQEIKRNAMHAKLREIKTVKIARVSITSSLHPRVRRKDPKSKLAVTQGRRRYRKRKTMEQSQTIDLLSLHMKPTNLSEEEIGGRKLNDRDLRLLLSVSKHLAANERRL